LFNIQRWTPTAALVAAKKDLDPIFLTIAESETDPNALFFFASYVGDYYRGDSSKRLALFDKVIQSAYAPESLREKARQLRNAEERGLLPASRASQAGTKSKQ
jgi:hypothetical protein